MSNDKEVEYVPNQLDISIVEVHMGGWLILVNDIAYQHAATKEQLLVNVCKLITNSIEIPPEGKEPTTEQTKPQPENSENVQ